MRTVRAMVGASLVAVFLFVGAGVAAAHVTVDPESVPKGASDVTLTFRVPNEEPSADTTSVDISFPTDNPIAVVDALAPSDGWTVKVTTKHLDTPITTDDGSFSDVVSEIDWTGGKISPGQYGEFKVLAQGVPSEVASLTFPTVQTYSDGTVVSWIQETVPGGAEPDHPAPSITLTAATDSGGSTDSGSAASSSAQGSSSSSQTAAGPASSQTVVKKEASNGLVIVAIAFGVVALLAAIAALVRKPRPS